MRVNQFLVYTEQYEWLKELSNEQLGQLFRELFEYASQEDYRPSFSDQAVSMAFSFIRQQLDRAQERYKEKCRQNTVNINQRWHGAESKSMQTDTTVYDRIQSNTTGYHNKNNSNSKNNSRNSERGGNTACFCPPSFEDLTSYCSSNGLEIDVPQFLDYYTARGWTLSNGAPMKDWKAAARSWARRGAKFRRLPTAPAAPGEEVLRTLATPDDFED